MPRGRKKVHQTQEEKKDANREAARRYRAKSRTSTASVKSADSSNQSFNISTVPAFEAENEIADSEPGSDASGNEYELGVDSRRATDQDNAQLGAGNQDVRTENAAPFGSALSWRPSGWNSLFYRAHKARDNTNTAEIPPAEPQIDESSEAELVLDTQIQFQLTSEQDAQLSVPTNTIDDTPDFGDLSEGEPVYKFEDFVLDDDRGGDFLLPSEPVMDAVNAAAGALAFGDDEEIEIIDETRSEKLVEQFCDVTDEETEIESDDGDDDQEAFKEAKRKFVTAFSRQLQCFHGCGDDENEHNGGHDEQTLGTHAGLLKVITSSEGLPKVLRLGKKLLQDTKQQVHPNDFARCFTGESIPRKNGSTGTKPRVCLSCDSERTWEQFDSGDSSDGPGTSVFADIDSAFSFPTSLGVAKHGIDVAFSSVWGTTLKTNLHFYRDVTWTQGGRRMAGSVPLHQIPHMRLGSIRTLEQSDLFVFFPQAYIGRDSFRQLLDSQLELWTNCFLEVIREVLPRSRTQHLPPSYKVAELASLARHDETRILENSGEPRKEYRHFYLPADSLERIWETVVARLRSVRGLKHLQEPFLFINCKNWKNATKARTLEGAYSAFRKLWDISIDVAYVPEHEGLFVDWGKETVREKGEPQTYLWRACCIKSYFNCFRDMAGLKQRSPPNLHIHAMLIDAAGLRMSVPRKSKVRRVGFVFTQMYHSSKEMFDANKTFPFAHKKLESLALDPKVQQSIQNKKQGDASKAGTERAYLNSRNRVNAAIEGSRILSFGVREEHRMSVELLELLLADIGEIASTETLEPDLWPIYAVPTTLYADFLSANVNKFCSAFEYVLADFKGRFIPPEVTKVLVLFLRCVRVSYGDSLLSQQWALWADKAREGAQGPRAEWQGIGFSKAVDSGYCWYMNKIDWRKMVFLSEFADGMSFGISSKFMGFARTGDEIEAIRSEFDENGKLQQLYTQYGANSRCQELITTAMTKLILRLFRVAIAEAVKEECKEGGFRLLADGNYALCYKTMEAAFGKPPIVVLAGPGRTFSSVGQVVEYYFGANDDAKRGAGWSRKPFRMIYEANKEFLGNYGTRAVSSLVHKVERAIRLTCWLLPLGRPAEGKFITRGRYGVVKYGPKQSQGELRFRWTATTHQFLLEQARPGAQASPRKQEIVAWKSLLELDQIVKAEQKKGSNKGRLNSDGGWELAKKDSDVLHRICPGMIADGFLGGNVADLAASCSETVARASKNAVRGELSYRARSRSRPRGETPSQFGDFSDGEETKHRVEKSSRERRKHFFVLMEQYGALICTECRSAVSPGVTGARDHLKRHPEINSKTKQEIVAWSGKQLTTRPRDLHVPQQPIREAVPYLAEPRAGYSCPYCEIFSTSDRKIIEHQRFDHHRKTRRVKEVLMQSWTQGAMESWWEVDDGAAETMASSFAAAQRDHRVSPSVELVN